jgi:hypothetical protein
MEPAARLLPHQFGPAAFRLTDHRSGDQAARHVERHARVVALHPGSEGLPRLHRLQRSLRA